MLMRHQIFTILLLIVWAAGAALPAATNPQSDTKAVAAIVSVTGAATIVRPGGTQESAMTGRLLARGDVLRTNAGARVQLALNDGTGFEIEGEQTVTMPPAKRSGIRVLAGRAWQAVVAKFRSLWGNEKTQAVLAGTRDLGPLGVQPAPTEGPDWVLQRSKVLAGRPVFLWPGVEEAVRYHLCVERRDGKGQWERVVEADPAQAPEALVVATPTDLPLEAGGVYRWHVWTETQDPEKSERRPWSSFQVATDKEAQKVQSALEELQSSQKEALPLAADVLQGILYEGHGFFADALWAYQRAALKRTEDQGLKALIADLRERSE